MNGRCVYCDHAEGCHLGPGLSADNIFNRPLSDIVTRILADTFDNREMFATATSKMTPSISIDDVVNQMREIGDVITGFKLMESSFLCKNVSEQVERTSKERWLSWPWKPWVKYKTIIRQEIDQNVYILTTGGERIIVGHPKIIAIIRKELSGLEKWYESV